MALTTSEASALAANYQECLAPQITVYGDLTIDIGAAFNSAGAYLTAVVAQNIKDAFALWLDNNRTKIGIGIGNNTSLGGFVLWIVGEFSPTYSPGGGA